MIQKQIKHIDEVYVFLIHWLIIDKIKYNRNDNQSTKLIKLLINIINQLILCLFIKILMPFH